MRCNKKGFSLIELMVALAIMGILGGVGIPTYIGMNQRGKRAEFKTNLEVLRMLEAKNYAEKTEFAGGLDTSLLMTAFPEFKPGDEEDLNYTYSVVTANDDQEFTAFATGKADTADEGRWFSVDNDNSRECGPDACADGW